ncbi:unnamed protein product, partial [Meganyctiphanes norvegica]
SVQCFVKWREMSSLTSSDDPPVPTVFQVTPTGDRYSSHDHCTLERCPLCNQKTKAFYCKECVRNGNFYHSQLKIPERILRQKTGHLSSSRERPMMEPGHEEKELTSAGHTRYLIKEKMAEVRDRIELMQRVVDNTRDSTKLIKKQSIEVANSNAKRKRDLPLFQQRLIKMCGILMQYQEKIGGKKEMLAISEAQLKGVVRGNIRQLTRYIFPITEVQPARSLDSDPEHLDTVSAIAEASQTTYVRGRWVYTDTSHETQYRIVSPLLPGSGDYSTYNLIAHGSSGLVSLSATIIKTVDLKGHPRSLETCVNLSFLAPIYHTQTQCCDIKKIIHSEFCRHELSEAQFTRRVSRLNTNVIYLCLSQNVPPDMLRPLQTTSNLLTVLDTQSSDLGRQGSFEVFDTLLESMEEGMQEETGEVSDSEEEEDTDTLSSEWETDPLIHM